VILRDQPLFRALARVPRGDLGVVWQTVAAIEADFPDLPGAGDLEFHVPPSATRWRRRAGGSSWWVVYSWVPESETLILRTVTDQV
jgi:hypothetical protein